MTFSRQTGRESTLGMSQSLHRFDNIQSSNVFSTFNTLQMFKMPFPQSSRNAVNIMQCIFGSNHLLATKQLALTSSYKPYIAFTFKFAFKRSQNLHSVNANFDKLGHSHH